MCKVWIMIYFKRNNYIRRVGWMSKISLAFDDSVFLVRFISRRNHCIIVRIICSRSLSLHVASPKSQQTTDPSIYLAHLSRCSLAVHRRRISVRCRAVRVPLSACGALIEGLHPRGYRGHLQFKCRLLYSSSVRPRDSRAVIRFLEGTRRPRSTAGKRRGKRERVK